MQTKLEKLWTRRTLANAQFTVTNWVVFVPATQELRNKRVKEVTEIAKDLIPDGAYSISAGHYGVDVYLNDENVAMMLFLRLQ